MRVWRQFLPQDKTFILSCLNLKWGETERIETKRETERQGETKTEKIQRNKESAKA